MKIETKIYKIIKKAIPLALLDREHFLECISDCIEKESVVREIEEIKSQTGLAFKDLDANIVNMILLYAEQQELGYAFSIEKVKEMKVFHKRSMLLSKEFRDLRHSIFGKTKLEEFIDSAKSVDIFEYKDKL